MTIDPRRVIDDPKISYRAAGGWIDALSGTFTPLLGWPTATNVGVAAIPGWEPTRTLVDENLFMFEEGGVVEDVRIINGGIGVNVPHVTVRRCEIINGGIFNDYHSTWQNDMRIEDCTIRSDPPGLWMANIYNTAAGFAGFTMKRCAIIDTNEGIHTGGSDIPLADPDDPLGYGVKLYDCYTNVIGPRSSETGLYCQYDAAASAADPTHPPVGSWIDWHGDTIQAEDGPTGSGLGGVPLTVRNCSNHSRDHTDPEDLISPDLGCGASAIFYTRPGMSMPPDVENLIVEGAGFSIHNGCGGRWRNVHIIKDSYYYGPISFERWDNITLWEDVFISTWGEDGNPVPYGRVPFGYPGYGPLDPL